MSNSWFRVYSEFATDAKVQSMPEAMQRRLMMLFCLRCSDVLVTLSDDELAFQLRISDADLAETKALFVRKGFINDAWEIANWDKRQFVSDSSAQRTKAYRERQKNKTVTSQERQGDSLDTDTDTDTKTDQKKKAPSGAVIAPAVAGGVDLAGDEIVPPKDSKADLIPVCPVGEIVNAYHDLMPLNPKVRVLDDARKKAIRARWREAAVMTIKPFGYLTQVQGLASWKRFFEVCAESQFLTGRAAGSPGKPPFVADIDFLLSPSGFKKCLENKYHRDAS